MAIVESLADNRRNRSHESKGSKDSHTTGGGDKVSPDAAKHWKGNGPYTQEDKGKAKLRAFTPRL